MIMRILVPRFLDALNTNAQNLNAKALLARFNDPEIEWCATHYNQPDSYVEQNKRVRLVRLWRSRMSRFRMFLFYLQRAEALFYPGGVSYAAYGLRLGKYLNPKRVVVATLEGIAGTEDRERELSQLVGHQIYCHRVDLKTQQQLDDVLHQADHIIAISPFLARIGTYLYGDKCSVLPLGIDNDTFYQMPKKLLNSVPVIVSAGNVNAHKRPEVFLELARRFPNAQFRWFGDGKLREQMIEAARSQGIDNLEFPGSLQPAELAEQFRKADIFVLPSLSEGVPKVSQEAASCGLPVVLFGFYEAPSIIDGENGYVVWDDMEFFERIAELLISPDLRRMMGERGAHMAQELSWDVIAMQWEQRVKQIVTLSA